MKESRWVQGYSALSLGLLIIGCIWAVRKLAIWESVGELWKDPWFKVTLGDLYIGFGFVAAFIAHRERSVAKSAVWSLLLAGLGNIVTALYVLIELPKSKLNNRSFFERKQDDWTVL